MDTQLFQLLCFYAFAAVTVRPQLAVITVRTRCMRCWPGAHVFHRRLPVDAGRRRVPRASH